MSNGGGPRYTPIDRVAPDYKPQTSSQADRRVFKTARELDEHLRSVCKFVDYMIEGVRVVGLDTKTKGWIYEVYQSGSLDVALKFLEAIPINEIPETYYIIVETPFGNVGKDLNGIFDE
jgi:hypothetical protein